MGSGASQPAQPAPAPRLPPQVQQRAYWPPPPYPNQQPMYRVTTPYGVPRPQFAPPQAAPYRHASPTPQNNAAPADSPPMAHPEPRLDHTPPPTPDLHQHYVDVGRTQSTLYHSESEESEGESNMHLQSALLQSYGEQDYELQEMTWPGQGCDMLLTDKDIREGDDFIAQMEEKRVLYESLQIQLLRKLQVEARTDEKEVNDTCDLITDLCQLHHFLYGGSDDELGIEFVPVQDASEDDYILEQIETLTRRHHKELKDSDRLCAGKLLEGRGNEMTEQKLDSILEEHIKLRSYMRTRQTKDQISAYHEVKSAIKANPNLYQSSQQKVGQTGTAKLVTAIAAHPIVNRLPPLSQSKLKAIGATRGRTVIVDQSGNITKPSTTTSSAATSTRRDNAEGGDNSSTHVTPQRQTEQLGSPSIWSRTDVEESGGRKAVAASGVTQSSNTASGGFQVVTADPRYISAVNFTTQTEEGGESSSLLRTGVVQGSVLNKISQFNATPAASEHLTRPPAKGSDVVDFGDSADEEEDLLAQYQRTMKGAGDSDDSSSLSSTDRAPPPAELQRSNSETSTDSNSKLQASNHLNDQLTDAIWEHQSEINPQSFHQLISLWQSRQQDIVEKGVEEDVPSSGKALWQKVKEQIMYKALANSSTAEDGNDSDEEETGVSTSTSTHGVSTSMQTSLPLGHNMSVQTDAVGVDAETLVDEFFTDEQELKKIKKMDKQLVDSLASKELSEDDIRELMARNRENIDKLRKQREANRLKSLQLLDERRAKRGGRDQESDDEETSRKLNKIEQRVTNKLIKHRDKISEKDMKNLLAEARRQQEEIRRQRNVERLRQNEQMKAKLLKKRKAKMGAMNESSAGDKMMSLEDQFYQDLKSKLASGRLSHEQFKLLIEEHLAKMSRASGLSATPQRRTTHQDDDVTKSTTEAIRRGKENDKAIQDGRQRAREKARAELEQRRKMKKEKTVTQ